MRAMSKQQKAQNLLARAVTSSFQPSSYTLLQHLQWLHTEYCIDFKTVAYSEGCREGMPPRSQSSLWPPGKVGYSGAQKNNSFDNRAYACFFPKNDAIISDNFLPTNAPKLTYSD